MASYDVIFIGGGPAGYVGAIRAAQAFLQVAPDGQDAETVKKLMDEARKRSDPPPR